MWSIWHDNFPRWQAKSDSLDVLLFFSRLWCHCIEKWTRRAKIVSAYRSGERRLYTKILDLYISSKEILKCCWQFYQFVSWFESKLIIAITYAACVGVSRWRSVQNYCDYQHNKARARSSCQLERLFGNSIFALRRLEWHSNNVWNARNARALLANKLTEILLTCAR